MRMPIARRRSTTEAASTPQMPTAASTTAMIENAPTSSRRQTASGRFMEGAHANGSMPGYT
jgi:hypothetical protein